MRIALFLMDRCFGSGIHSIIDALITANYAMHKSGIAPLFSWDSVALSANPISPTNGITIQPDYALADYLSSHQPDIWIIPAVFHSFSDIGKAQHAIEDLQPIIPVLRNHHQQGKILVSICSGSFLLAEAGLLNAYPALMHWKSEPLFQRMFPKIMIDTERTVADYGNIICTVGGGNAYEYLVLHLVERFAGHHTAVNTAKLMMINLNPPSPSPFRDTLEQAQHQDKLVLKVQRYLDQHSTEELDFNQLSQRFHISERQMNRRFSRALNMTPYQYLQKARLHHACNLLEASELPSSRIVYETGYRDESSFRRLFKKRIGTTMEHYRQQFGAR